MAVQTFNIDKSMVTCNLPTYCRSISEKKKKNSRIVLVFVILFFDRALGRFLGHDLFDPIKFYEIISFHDFAFWSYFEYV